MPSVFQNLAGIPWAYSRIDWWGHYFYTPWFGFGFNFHPNRFKQVMGWL